MTKKQFLDNITTDSSYCNVLATIHPKQLLSNNIEQGVYEIIYKYTTDRGNEKEAKKYLLLHEMDWDRIVPEFFANLDQRYISNVEILDTNYLGKVYLKIE